jgi:hypothetical protein
MLETYLVDQKVAWKVDCSAELLVV